MSFVPSYGVWKERFFKSEVIQWKAPLLRSQLRVVEESAVATWARGFHGVEGRGCHWLPKRRGGCRFRYCWQKIGHLETTCPWVLHHWQRSRNGRGGGRPSWLVVGWPIAGPWEDEGQEDRVERLLFWPGVDLVFVRLAEAGRGDELIFWLRESFLLIIFSCSSSKEIRVSRPLRTSITGWYLSSRPSRIFSMRSSWSRGLPSAASSSARVFMAYI